MPKTKSGEKISWKEFMKRWKEGIEGITPIQKLKNDYISQIISFVGFLSCLIVLIIYRKQFFVSWFSYGLMLIFLGSSWSSAIKVLVIKQQLKFFKETDSQSINVKDILKGGDKK